MNEFFTAVVNGFGLGSVYSLLALGFAFIYRTTASFNFAQGQLLTVGSLFAYTFATALGLPAIVAALAIMLILAFIGALVERVAIYPLARRGDETLTWLISTLGVAVLLTGISERIWGSQPLGVQNYLGPPVAHLPFYHVNIATPYLIAFGVAIFSTLGIEAFQRWTLWGRAMRAVGDNRAAVELAGINVMVLGLVAFMVGGALAGIAGFVLAPVTYAQATGGFTFTILAFAGLAIGGFASHWGALLGGWIVGLVESIAGTYIGLNYQDLIVLGVLVLFLLVRPQGLWSAQTRRV
jgi:branched-chain amino acid transport system permease protein